MLETDVPAGMREAVGVQVERPCCIDGGVMLLCKMSSCRGMMLVELGALRNEKNEKYGTESM